LLPCKRAARTLEQDQASDQHMKREKLRAAALLLDTEQSMVDTCACNTCRVDIATLKARNSAKNAARQYVAGARVALTNCRRRQSSAANAACRCRSPPRSVHHASTARLRPFGPPQSPRTWQPPIGARPWSSSASAAAPRCARAAMQSRFSRCSGRAQQWNTALG